MLDVFTQTINFYFFKEERFRLGVMQYYGASKKKGKAQIIYCLHYVCVCMCCFIPSKVSAGTLHAYVCILDSCMSSCCWWCQCWHLLSSGPYWEKLLQIEQVVLSISICLDLLEETQLKRDQFLGKFNFLISLSGISWTFSVFWC